MESKFVGALQRVLLCHMPEELRKEITAALASPAICENEYQLKSLCEKCTKRLVLTQPRESINWHPTVDTALCTGCKKCHNYCPHGVYTMVDGKASAAHPYECVILCSNCKPLCPAGAISFPEQKAYIDFLRYK